MLLAARWTVVIVSVLWTRGILHQDTLPMILTRLKTASAYIELTSLMVESAACEHNNSWRILSGYSKCFFCFLQHQQVYRYR